MNKYFSLALIGTLGLTSCFKDEAANSECDITEAYVHLESPTDVFFSPTDTLRSVLYTQSEIHFDNVRNKADLTALAPIFKITQGATISPANGTTHDFSNGPVEYTVTSEDGEWQRKYNVSFVRTVRTTKDTLEYDFENPHLDQAGKYYIWSQPHEDGTLYDDWATGNAGWGMVNQRKQADEYPSSVLDEGFEGKGVKLVTTSTGSWGVYSKMLIAAGNLFLGEFDMNKALQKPREATTFGKTFDKKPKSFSGYYKYKPGEKFQNQDGSIVEGKVDQAAIYALLYKKEFDENGKEIKLNGDNVQTGANIVAKAIVNTIPPTDEWTKFEVDFTELEPFDQELANNRGYNLVIVFSSSTDGAFFQGAIGSTLCIDKVRIACEKTE